jgi:hypothetical protein
MVGVVRVVAQAQAQLAQKAVAVNKYATQATVVTLTNMRVILKALVAVQAQAALLVRSVRTSLFSTQAQAQAQTKVVGTRFYGGQAVTPTRTAQVNVNKVAAQSMAARMTALLVVVKNLIATQAQVVTMRRALSKFVLIAQGTTIPIRKAITQSARFATQAISARLTIGNTTFIRVRKIYLTAKRTFYTLIGKDTTHRSYRAKEDQ